MRCTDTRTLIESYVDGELDLVRNVEIEEHLGDCPICAPMHKDTLALRSRIREDVSYFRAPTDLHQRVRAITAEKRAKTSRSWAPLWAWPGATAAVVLLAVITVGLIRSAAESSRGQMIAQEIVADHVRSLMADHLTDVTSTDQHTVKPWFLGKLDFSPPVTDLAQAGFPLTGGRLDYVAGRAVAALVYTAGQHTINVFVWPEADAARSPDARAIRGFHVRHWTQGGMSYWAVSDVNDAELDQFVHALQLFRAQ